MYEVDKIQYLQIGVQGENVATDIEIDMSKWVEKYPSAVFHILFKPYNEQTPSPQVCSYEDGVLTWTVGVGATSVVGVGYTEIRAQDPSTGLVKKTRIIPTAVENSVSGVSTDPPASYQEWVNSVLNAGSDSEAYACGTRNGADVGDTDPAYHNNSDYYRVLAEAAKTAAENARDAAQAAAGDFQGMTAEAETLPPGADATVEVTHSEGGMYHFAFGVTKGDKGETGDPAPADQVVPAVNAYLQGVITNPSSPPLDRTLSSSSGAAPADMVGDLKSAFIQQEYQIAGIYSVANTSSQHTLFYLPKGKEITVSKR